MYEAPCMQPSRVYTRARATHARERDASRAAALNYRPDAILMRSIIYGARHRPLNIPRSTKESSRYPGIIPGQYSRIVAPKVQTRRSHRARNAIFASLQWRYGKAGRSSRGIGTCRDGEKIPPSRSIPGKIGGDSGDDSENVPR